MLKYWASQSCEINYDRISGLTALKYNATVLVQKPHVKSLLSVFSPNVMYPKWNQRQYMPLREGVWPTDKCGKWTHIGVVGNKDGSAAGAQHSPAILRSRTATWRRRGIKKSTSELYHEDKPSNFW